MSVKEAASTSILSRRWRYLWTQMTNIDFRSFGDRSLIDRMLVFHKGSKIQAFKVIVGCEDEADSGSESYDQAAINQFNSWAYFAVSPFVEELSLKTYCQKSPDCVFRCSSVKELELGCKRLNQPSYIRLDSLTKLNLSHIHLSGNGIKCLTSGCPVINFLFWDHCNPGSKLSINVTNPSFKKLVVFGHDSSGEIEIDAASVLSLEFCGSFTKIVCVKNLAAATNLSFRIRTPLGRGFMITCRGLVIGLQPVKLQMNWFCISVIFCQWKYAPPNSIKTTCLHLTSDLAPTHLAPTQIQAVTLLIMAFPNLENLILDSIDHLFIQKVDKIDLRENYESFVCAWKCLESSTPYGKSLKKHRDKWNSQCITLHVR